MWAFSNSLRVFNGKLKLNVEIVHIMVIHLSGQSAKIEHSDWFLSGRLSSARKILDCIACGCDKRVFVDLLDCSP
jgi:hypothetical protein